MCNKVINYLCLLCAHNVLMYLHYLLKATINIFFSHLDIFIFFNKSQSNLLILV